MSKSTLVIGSRGSTLARWQSNFVKERLAAAFPALTIEIALIKTTGDKILDAPLSRIGDKGLFTKELEHALLEKRIDLAVHSLKDLPTIVPEGLTIAAIGKREDVSDVFVAHPRTSHRSLGALPHGAVIATGSLRRKCQLLSWRPDLSIVDLRGNLETRLAKLDASHWDGIVLAKAGLLRLGLDHRITEVLPTDRMLPAVGQGALAIETRADDRTTLRYVESFHHDATAIATRGERALLRRLEGGCQVPIGTFGRLEHGEFLLDAMIGSLDGRHIVRGKIHGEPQRAEELGTALAETLEASGGGAILREIRNAATIPAAAV
jgi:hydroxymethylbilane synthase